MKLASPKTWGCSSPTVIELGMCCSCHFYHYNVTQSLSVVLPGKARISTFDMLPCSSLRKLQFSKKMSLNMHYIYLVLYKQCLQLCYPDTTTTMKQHASRSEQATNKEVFNKPLHKGKVDSQPCQDESRRTAEYTYITKLLTRSTGNKRSISEESAKLRSVLTAWQATNRLPGERERTRTACIFTQPSMTCVCMVHSETASHRKRVTLRSQNWHVYFLTIIMTH